MRIFQNLQERQALEAAEEQNFVEQCREEFVEKSIAASNLRKVRQLTIASYLPNMLSAVTAGFFVLFLLSGYSTTVAVLLGALLLLIVVAVELGKRLLIGATAHSHFVLSKLPALSIGALLLLFAVSMGASYQGGKALVVETAPPPPRSHNPQIDSLNQLLRAELSTIDRLQRTTWRGKITGDAVKGINQSKRVQSSIVDRITALETLDDAAHREAVTKHTSKHLNFGYLLGVLAAVADVFLLGMLWTAKRLKYQVAAVHHQGATAKGAGMLNPYAGQQGAHLLNQVEPQRRGIGFTADRDDKPYNDKSYNGKSYNDTTPEREVVTVTEREVVELTDRVKTCAHCGQRFRYFNSKAKYCSDGCRISAWEQRTGRAWKGGRP